VRALTRRGLIGGGAALLLATAAPRGAEADLFGGDLGLLSQLITQSLAQIAQFTSMISQLVMTVNLLKMQLQAISHGDLMAILSFVQTAQMSYRSLTSNIQSMAFSLGLVSQEFHRLFPSSHPAPSPAQNDAHYSQWNTEILAASEVASRQQAVLSDLDQHAAAANQVLESSKNAEGVVAQLQTVVQMLRLMQTELITVNQTLATTGRVLSDMAAADASNRQLSRAKKGSSLGGYTNRGAPVAVPHRLP
jgi:P-type conjugative transfer protein TrbJ